MLIKSSLKSTCLAIFTLTSFNYAHADITLTSSIALPSNPGTGLAGSYYALNSEPLTLANAETLIGQAAAPTATFTATSVCFPSCNNTIGDGSTLAEYLGGNATNISANTITSLGDHAVVLDGYIAISTAGSYQFGLSSDDGSQLQIGGSTIINDDGDHSFGGGTATVDFTNAGLYSFNLLAFEDAGVTGVTVLENSNALTASELYAIVASTPSSVAEPENVTMFALGLLGIIAATRKKTWIALHPVPHKALKSNHP